VGQAAAQIPWQEKISRNTKELAKRGEKDSFSGVSMERRAVRSIVKGGWEKSFVPGR